MYRDQAPQGPVCAKHANAAAAGACATCGNPVCELCLVYDLARPHCHPCASRARRRRRMRAAAVLGAAVAVVVAGMVYVVTRPVSFDYGARAGKVGDLRTRVGKDRCDRKTTVELEETLIAAGDQRGALADSDAFFAKCGDWYRLRWARYTAHERLDEHAQAAAEATLLIRHNPDDHDYRWWRGVAYESANRLDEAVADYRAALAITPNLSNIPFNLARVLERQGKYCEATAPILAFLRYHPDQSQTPHIQAQLLRLDQAGHCTTD
jgi:Flp pilus assembly protein TadD